MTRNDCGMEIITHPHFSDSVYMHHKTIIIGPALSSLLCSCLMITNRNYYKAWMLENIMLLQAPAQKVEFKGWLIGIQSNKFQFPKPVFLVTSSDFFFPQKFNVEAQQMINVLILCRVMFSKFMSEDPLSSRLFLSYFLRVQWICFDTVIIIEQYFSPYNSIFKLFLKH